MSLLRQTKRAHSPFAVWRWSRRTICGWVAIFIVIGYPASFGPACWLAARSPSPSTMLQVISQVYKLVAITIILGPKPYSSFMRWHLKYGLPGHVVLQDDSQGIHLSFPVYTYTILSL